jgi:hypothetical protein
MATSAMVLPLMPDGLSRVWKLGMGKVLLALVTAYGSMLASLYLTGYWGRFGINPFYLASTADLLTATLMSLPSTFAFIGVGAGFGYWLGDGAASTKRPLARFLSRISTALSVILPLLAVVFLPGTRVYFFGALCSLVAVIIVGKTRLRFFFNHSPRAVAVTIFMLVYVPFAVFGLGRSRAETAVSPTSSWLIDQGQSKLPVSSSGQMTYLGTLGTYHLLYELTERAVVMGRAEEMMLVIRAPSQDTKPVSVTTGGSQSAAVTSGRCSQPALRETNQAHRTICKG